MTVRRSYLYPFLLAVLCSGLAQANQINLFCSAIGPANPVSATVVCPQYNSDGVMTLVTLTLAGKLDGTITLNDGDTNAAASSPVSSVAAFNFGLPEIQVPIPQVAAVSAGNQALAGGRSSQNSSSKSPNSQTPDVSSGNTTGPDTSTSKTNVEPGGAGGTFGVPVPEQTATNVSAGGNLGVSVPADLLGTSSAGDTFAPASTSAIALDPMLPVPEPATWLLSTLAMAAIGYRLRRRTA